MKLIFIRTDVDKGNFYHDYEKSNNTYLNEENNIYVRCYLRYKSYENGGNEKQHNLQLV